MPRAGLRLFARHAAQFNQYLFDDYEVDILCEKICIYFFHLNENILNDVAL